MREECLTGTARGLSSPSCPFATIEPVDGTGTTRLEAFSDGVFAIAATLLVLEFSVGPAASAHQLAAFYLPSAALFSRA
jgi:Endosomal/lysosomal potassium channel TMEM175